MTLQITDHITIDEAELDEQFIRASGPGGQHVNKTSSAVQLRFDLRANRTLPPDAKFRAKRLAGSRLTKDGVIIIEADSHRSQSANREDARRRLAQLLREALVRPKPRKKTRPTKGSVERRIKAKKERGQIKARRGSVDPD